MKLYELTEKYQKALDAIYTDEDGVIVGIENLDAVSGDLDEKLEACSLDFKNRKAEIEAIKTEIKVLQDRVKSAENRNEWLEGYIAYNMNSCGKTELKTSKVALSFRKSVKTNVLDETLLPKEYLKETITVKPDLTAIKNAIKGGRTVAGAELVENMNLQIK